MAQETIDLVHAFYEDTNTANSFPGKRIMQAYTERCSQTKVVSSVISMNCLLHLKKETQM